SRLRTISKTRVRMVSSARAATSLALAAAEVSASSEARKRGAEQGALRAERQRGGKAAPVRDPAGCYHHHLVVALPHSVDDRRHERQGRAANDCARPPANRSRARSRSITH